MYFCMYHIYANIITLIIKVILGTKLCMHHVQHTYFAKTDVIPICSASVCTTFTLTFLNVILLSR